MNRNPLIDLLKLILAFMVVGLHTHFLVDFSVFSSYATINGLFRIAVPLFFMINGFYFDKIIQNKQLLTWLKKGVLLYITWMVIYLYFWFPYKDFRFSKLLTIIFIGYFHLWYLIAYVFSGIFLYLFRKKSNQLLFTISILLFITGVFIQYSGNYHLFKHNEELDKILNYIPNYRNFLFFGFPFFTVGYLIKNSSISEKIRFSKIKIYTVIAFILFFAEIVFNYFNTPIDEKNDLFFSLIFICPILFIWVLKTPISISFETKNLSNLAVGIYLIHPLCFMLLRKYDISPKGTLTTIITIFSATLLAYLVLKMNKKLKILL